MWVRRIEFQLTTPVGLFWRHAHPLTAQLLTQYKDFGESNREHVANAMRWLDRELEAAVRARALMLVEVAMPDGSSRELTLEASGIGGGRLRGRDHAADVERTLPVRSIRSVRVLES